jgi:addiction module HigA family antidote
MSFRGRKKGLGPIGLPAIGESPFDLTALMQWSSIIEIISKFGGFQMKSRRRPTHPGEVLREDVIKPLGLTVTEAAKRLGVTRKTLSALINCRASMSPEMAVRIGKATRTSPESWLYMQSKLDLWLAEQKPPVVEEFEEVAPL